MRFNMIQFYKKDKELVLVGHMSFWKCKFKTYHSCRVVIAQISGNLDRAFSPEKCNEIRVVSSCVYRYMGQAHSQALTWNIK